MKDDTDSSFFSSKENSRTRHKAQRFSGALGIPHLSKPKSRFNMAFGSNFSVQRSTSILEDYMLEDDDDGPPASHPKRLEHLNYDKSSSEASTLGQWSAVTEKPPSAKKPELPITTPTPVWPPPNQPPPTNFQPFHQPPPTFSQPNYYQYEYPQQHPSAPQPYAGYQNYYQGYQDYTQQQWAAANSQPPPPGLLLPDMTQPPPIQTTVVPAPVPMPIAAPSKPTPPKIQLSPEVRHHRRGKESRKERNRDSSRNEDRAKGGKESSASKESEKDELHSQREAYLTKSAKLTKDLKFLQNQKRELLGDTHPDSKLIEENHKLQEEVLNKLKAINNVVNMLNGILKPRDESRSDRKRRSRSRSRSRERSRRSEKERKPRRSSSSSSEEEVKQQKVVKKVEEGKSADEEETDEKKAPPPEINLTFFDPEEHWCHYCGVFPATAKEYLYHLHSQDHKQNIQRKKSSDVPWHTDNVEKERPFYNGAPTKRVPIKGLQFFVPVTGWFCKLCNAWIGDLHCASLHLKSQRHIDNYETFVDENRGWEETWFDQRKDALKREELENGSSIVQAVMAEESNSRPASNLEVSSKSRDSFADKSNSPAILRESLKITVANVEMQNEDSSRNVQKNKFDVVPPMGPVLPPQKKSNWITADSSPASNGSSKGQWVDKQVVSEAEKQMVKNLKEKYKKKYDEEEYHSSRKDDRKDRRRDRRGRDDRSRSRDRSRSNSRGRDRYGREKDYHSRSRSRDRHSRSRSRDRHSRSRSRDRHGRRRKSSSPPPRKDRSHSHTPERKPKIEPKKWVAPPSSPPPYITRKTDDKDKWDKPKKKPTPNPVASLPKSKLPFIGRMPLFKRLAQKKQSDDNQVKASEPPSDVNTDRRAPEDMDIDSGASDTEQQPSQSQQNKIEVPSLVAPQIEEVPVVEKPPVPASIPLPQDFQDALSILFPNELILQGPAAAAAAAVIPPTPVAPLSETVAPPPLPVEKPAPPSKRDCSISQEELLMLGIDPEDMVAQLL